MYLYFCNNYFSDCNHLLQAYNKRLVNLKASTAEGIQPMGAIPEEADE